MVPQQSHVILMDEISESTAYCRAYFRNSLREYISQAERHFTYVSVKAGVHASHIITPLQSSLNRGGLCTCLRVCPSRRILPAAMSREAVVMATGENLTWLAGAVAGNLIQTVRGRQAGPPDEIAHRFIDEPMGYVIDLLHDAADDLANNSDEDELMEAHHGGGSHWMRRSRILRRSSGRRPMRS